MLVKFANDASEKIDCWKRMMQKTTECKLRGKKKYGQY